MEQVLSLLENGHDLLPNKPADHLGAAGCQLPRLRRRGQHTGRVPPAALLATLGLPALAALAFLALAVLTVTC
jgi:hypothetical protein